MLPIDKKMHYQKFKQNKNLRKEPQWVTIHFFSTVKNAERFQGLSFFSF